MKSPASRPRPPGRAARRPEDVRGVPYTTRPRRRSARAPGPRVRAEAARPSSAPVRGNDERVHLEARPRHAVEELRAPGSRRSPTCSTPAVRRRGPGRLVVGEGQEPMRSPSPRASPSAPPPPRSARPGAPDPRPVEQPEHVVEGSYSKSSTWLFAMETASIRAAAGSRRSSRRIGNERPSAARTRAGRGRRGRIPGCRSGGPPREDRSVSPQDSRDPPGATLRSRRAEHDVADEREPKRRRAGSAPDSRSSPWRPPPILLPRSSVSRPADPPVLA